MKKLLIQLTPLISFFLLLFFQSDIFAQEDPWQLYYRKYDFVYEREEQSAQLELHHKITLLANNELDPLINKAIHEWRKNGNQEKFNLATKVALQNYRIQCAKLENIFEKRMRWAKNNLHAESPQEALQAHARLMNKKLQDLLTNW